MPTPKDARQFGTSPQPSRKGEEARSESAPDFNLPSNTGEVSLADYRGKHGVVLYFVREFGCMSCQFNASALVKAYPEIQSAGFDILVIGGGEVVDAVKMAQRLRAPFPILADRERSVYERYHLDKTLGFIQKSATFVVDVSRKVIYAHRSTNPGASLDMPAILDATRAMID